MTELEVKDNTFYVLKMKQGESHKITLHSDLSSPISRIKEHLRTGASPEEVDLMVVEIAEENFKIKGVPWSEIAVRLIKET
jgi:hypothetical protein